MPEYTWLPLVDGKNDVDVNVTGGSITAAIDPNQTVPVSGVILNNVLVTVTGQPIETVVRSAENTLPVSGVVSIAGQPIRVDTGLTTGGSAVPTSGVVTNIVKTTIENQPTFILGGQPIATTTTVTGNIVVSSLKLSGGSFYIIQDSPISGIMTNPPGNPGNVQIQGTPNVNILSTTGTIPVTGVVHIADQPIFVDSELIIDQTLPVSGVILNTVSTTAVITNVPHVIIDSEPVVNVRQPLTTIIPSGVTINALPSVAINSLPNVTLNQPITAIIPSGVTVNAMPSVQVSSLPTVVLQQPITTITPSGITINSMPSVAVNSLPNVNLNQPITTITPSGITINSLPSVTIGNVPTVNVNQPITAIIPSGVSINTMPSVAISSLPNVNINQPVTTITPSGITINSMPAVSASITNTPTVVVGSQPILTTTTLVPSTSVQVSGVVKATNLAGTDLIPVGLQDGYATVAVQDVHVVDVLRELQTQLKIMNMHLSLLTDTHIRKEDVDDTD